MRRLLELQWLLALGAALVWLRLGELQWRQQDYWKQRGQDLRLDQESLPARRGRILDRQAQVLADNRPALQGVPLDGRSQALRAEAEEMGKKVPPLTALRYYPEGQAFCHVLGYLGEKGGQDGLEARFEASLAGKAGWRRWLVTAGGRRLRLIEEVVPVAGQDLNTHLDKELQMRAHAALQSVLQQLGQGRIAGDQPAGAVVAMEAGSGRIRALVSGPGFDLNRWGDPRQDSWRSQLLKASNSPLLNRAAAAQVAPASTFKVVTASVAPVKPARQFYCQGVTWIGTTPFHCFERRGHGLLNFEDSLSYSCDCAFYELGQELGATALLQHARQFGLGQVVGVELPSEQPGWLPDPARVDAGELANLSIGQGQLLVTPVQMARLMAAVARGGQLPFPHLTGPDREPQVLSGYNWSSIAVGLRGTVLKGTAASTGAAVLGLVGKTGTVENEPSQSNPRGYNHTWFVGYAPWPTGTGQDLVIAVFLERSGGYGGGLAAPIAAALLKER